MNWKDKVTWYGNGRVKRLDIGKYKWRRCVGGDLVESHAVRITVVG